MYVYNKCVALFYILISFIFHSQGRFLLTKKRFFITFRKLPALSMIIQIIFNSIFKKTFKQNLKCF